MQQNFREFLQTKLSWFDFEHLFEHLGLSPRGATMLLDNPRKGSKLELEKITQLIQKNDPRVKEELLVNQFNFGVTEIQEANS